MSSAPLALSESIDYQPSFVTALLLSILAPPLGLLGLLFFALPLLLRSQLSLALPTTFSSLLLFLVLTILLLALHETVHGLFMRLFGAHPRFGFVLAAGFLPTFYTTAMPHCFTKSQFLSIAAAPALLLSGLGFLLCLTPLAPLFILPLALHLGGCVGDVFTFVRVLREPSGTVCQDLFTSLRFYRPLASRPLAS